MSGSPVATADNSTPRPKIARRGRGRGGRGSHRAPASATPETQPEQQSSEALATNSRSNEPRAPRGPRGGKRGGRGGGSSQDNSRRRGRGRGGEGAAVGAGGRIFEGRLTRAERAFDEETAEGTGEAQEPELRANAPDFVPGASVSGDAVVISSAASTVGKGKSKSAQHRPPKVTTKSTAPDIATRIHEDIAHNLYECPICTSELGRRSRVWSCGLCWTVFHLSCVKKWSKNEGSAAQDAARRSADGASSAPRAWRCPGCNLPHEIFPSSYTCWRWTRVRYLDFLRTPAGKLARGLVKVAHIRAMRLAMLDRVLLALRWARRRIVFAEGIRRQSVARTLITRKDGVAARYVEICFPAANTPVLGRATRGFVDSKEEEKDSQLARDEDGTIEDWVGCFSCGDQCSRPFDCGVHFCEKGCHPQDAHPAHCPRSPDVVSHCPCGKTLLADTPNFSPRTSCEDPIPNCAEACGRILPCGHSCDQVCHTGPCGPCLRKVPVNCRCGRTTVVTVCHQGTTDAPWCFRICKAGLHCGRHACAERCCPGEQKAIERQAMRRKLKSHLRPSDEDVEAEHICTRVCGRPLKCGRHTCPEICHKGPCNTCREAIFEDIPCNCGRTVLSPPLPCGTTPPACSFPCERPKPCGHPQTAHNCHTDEEGCPKCPFLTEKKCLCGKRVLKNQPCWLAETRCGQVCGEPLKCGSHFCQKTCHRPGECEDASKPCQQPCGKTKALCGHPCTDACHAPYQCPEKTPCASTVTATCGCGRLRQSRRCNAAVASKGLPQQAQKAPTLTPLTCDDECARLERNRSLASALGVEINPSTTTAAAANVSLSNLPYSTETLDMYIQLSSTSPLSTLQTYESTLHSLATSTTQRSVRFQPAKSSLRAYIHSLATDWGFASESFDPEPHRHVFVLKPTTWTAPLLGVGPENSIGIGGKSVGECVKIRERQRLKEREAQRLAAAEAKALKDAAKAQQAADSANGGWAQVAASRRTNGVGAARAALAAPGASPWSVSMYAALAGDSGGWGPPKKEKLVLRSGVGAGKKSATAPPVAMTEVADSWEEEEEKEEQEEEARERELQSETAEGKTETEVEAVMTDGLSAVETTAEPASEPVVATD
ncbi:putative NF-X1 finger transcription factor [Aspergillus clavatus NRRL 1]|uniref:NF-X1 finger transcription factor, putative n=1 Tax=Aspergillus clavatus (strain ATCC 1007 / CBS 513.65 / DSM 816 / NCTC 3887 / NRRL 1 / QM 1276 / 107) TaxID=344612 RepID=A1CDF5_ASPCL|nr:NF-X1 finger transcription factor, putative [Aspergillus clavatus NRRL 1]EAW11882.1 NF-X1 finger transcription factor, putative [Aspergillus clavatus NRRL 1]